MEEDLLKIICCPNCQGNLKVVDNSLICDKCGKDYIIKDGIPVLLTERI